MASRRRSGSCGRRHAWEGRSLELMGWMRRRGRLELIVVLPDGSHLMLPAAWTDLQGAGRRAAVAGTLGYAGRPAGGAAGPGPVAAGWRRTGSAGDDRSALRGRGDRRSGAWIVSRTRRAAAGPCQACVERDRLPGPAARAAYCDCSRQRTRASSRCGSLAREPSTASGRPREAGYLDRPGDRGAWCPSWPSGMIAVARSEDRCSLRLELAENPAPAVALWELVGEQQRADRDDAASGVDRADDRRRTGRGGWDR